ncbi:MAG: type IV pilus modification PilV family protein [bacterium]
MKKILNNKGFSIIESVIGLTVMAILLTGLVHIVGTVAMIERKTDATLEAANLAESIIENIKKESVVLDDIDIGTRKKINSKFQKEINVVPYSYEKNLKEIIVSIYWSEKEKEQRYDLSIVVFQRE